MDLTPGPAEDQERSEGPKIPHEVYLAAALAQQVAWRPDEDPAYQRHIAELMTADPAFRVAIEAAHRAGREDAAKAIEPALESARSYHYRAALTKAINLARGQQPQPEPWQIRAAATGGGPCPTCRKPFWTHVCLSCSPDYQTPGKGCINCRSTGMDQTPCLPPRGGQHPRTPGEDVTP